MKLTDAISKLLELKTHSNLAEMYHEGMECQINVNNMGQTQAEDGNYFQDDAGNRWYNIRIPKNADTIPEFNLDRKVPFDLERYAMGIGLTGWNWKKLTSVFCIYDFDTIVGHSDNHTAKISESEMERVRVAASSIPWVTTRRSTGGKGLHLHVEFPIPESEDEANFIKTHNHSEHAALARSILGQMSALADYDFSAAVDICGGNTWFYHLKMVPTKGEGLKTIKDAERPIDIEEIPKNWRDHIRVTSGKGMKVIPEAVIKAGLEDQYTQMVSGRKFIELDVKHKKLFKFLTDKGLYWHWEGEDIRRLVTHTTHLKKAYQSMVFDTGERVKGFFETSSSGSTDYNCYCFPIRNGGWIVRRYSPGTKEHDSWNQDGSGWTRCWFNRDVTFEIACRSASGTVHPDKGYYSFKEGIHASEALKILNLDLKIPSSYSNQPVILRLNKFNKVSIVYEGANELAAKGLGDGWFLDSKKKEVSYTYKNDVLTTLDESEDTADVDGMLRHLISQGQDAGWCLNNAHGWIFEPIANIKLALAGAMGFSIKQLMQMLGSSVIDAWELTNRPFQAEYPGARVWNKDAAQLAYLPDLSNPPEPKDYKNWTSILNHIGGGLTEYILTDKWCVDNGIKTGGEYLKLWCASLFQYPMEPLPYLFLYGKQNTGKSMFHEALSMLFTKGYVRADSALNSKNDFNGELEGAVLCVVEETNVGGNKASANKMKDWVTSPKMSIHPKGGTPFTVDNSSHWVQCANDHSYCPQLDNDTRVTMVYVPQLNRDEYIPKGVFEIMLREEAKAFTTSLMSIVIPKSSDRLRIPIIETQEKKMAEADNKCPVLAFLEEGYEYSEGQAIEVSELHDKFMETIDKAEASHWPRSKFRTTIPPQYAKGKFLDNKMYVGNIWWRDKPIILEREGKFIVYDGKIILDTKARKHGLIIDDYEKDSN